MGRFAKIIELENDEQVLLTVDYNDEEDQYETKIRTDLQGVSVAAKLSFDTETKALDVLEKYVETDAIKFRKAMEELIEK